METADLRKNRLDLEYRFESQKALIFLTFGTITLLGFLTTIIIQKFYILAIELGFIVLVSAIILYTRTKKKLNQLLQKIEDLAK